MNEGSYMLYMERENHSKTVFVKRATEAGLINGVNIRPGDYLIFDTWSDVLLEAMSEVDFESKYELDEIPF